jgi:hypothetical protein
MYVKHGRNLRPCNIEPIVQYSATRSKTNSSKCRCKNRGLSFPSISGSCGDLATCTAAGPNRAHAMNGNVVGMKSGAQNLTARYMSNVWRLHRSEALEDGVGGIEGSSLPPCGESTSRPLAANSSSLCNSTAKEFALKLFKSVI